MNADTIIWELGKHLDYDPPEHIKTMIRTLEVEKEDAKRFADSQYSKAYMYNEFKVAMNKLERGESIRGGK